jgi:hypothetical protein
MFDNQGVTHRADVVVQKNGDPIDAIGECFANFSVCGVIQVSGLNSTLIESSTDTAPYIAHSDNNDVHGRRVSVKAKRSTDCYGKRHNATLL